MVFSENRKIILVDTAMRGILECTFRALKHQNTPYARQVYDPCTLWTVLLKVQLCLDRIVNSQSNLYRTDLYSTDYTLWDLGKFYINWTFKHYKTFEKAPENLHLILHTVLCESLHKCTYHFLEGIRCILVPTHICVFTWKKNVIIHWAIYNCLILHVKGIKKSYWK